ncbi:GNAT family N-acetyltransferase [Rhizobium sp. NPDC090279]|uniref:GNAT family N-acetyltransferase n=1 Tax=Rhizobium sp. NPDC090279 TaxID=3364499 RepID=UPI00383B243A
MTQISPVSTSLAEALVDDPFYRAMTVESDGDERKRQTVLAQYFDLAIAEARGIGEVQYAGTDGAAIWHTNEATDEDAARYIAARKQALAALLGRAGFDAYLRISESMATKVPPHLADAWYLSILGVRPAAQGQRLAQRLIELTVNRADRHGATCFLETFNPLSLPFYRRLGFGDEIRCFERVTGRDYWILTRQPPSVPNND